MSSAASSAARSPCGRGAGEGMRSSSEVVGRSFSLPQDPALARISRRSAACRARRGGAVGVVQAGRVERGEQVGPPGRRTPQRLVAPPAADRGVVAADAARRVRRARATRRLGVDRGLEQPVGVASPRRGTPALPSTPGSSRATASTTTSAATSPPAEHVVAERELLDAISRRGVLRDPGVDAFVAPARETRCGSTASSAAQRWVKRPPGRRGDDQHGVGASAVAPDRVEGLAPRLRPHHHARRRRRTACRRPCGAGRSCARAGRGRARRAGRVAGLADEREPERREVVREDRDDVDAQGGHRSVLGASARRRLVEVLEQARGGSTTTRPPRRRPRGRSRRRTARAPRRPSAVRTASRSCAGQVHDLGRPCRAACRHGAHAARPTSWWS